MVRARHALYDAGLMPEHLAPMPVVSIGGLEAGGTGKTPMVAVVMRRLLQAGLKPGLLTRGYRRAARGLCLRPPGAPISAHSVGDEAAMLVGQGLDVAVAACARRIVGARALATLGCDAAVMDDGLSHRALARALNIVMVRGEQPLAAARLLPWGSLREPATALGRANLVVVHYREGRAPEALPLSMANSLAPHVDLRAVLMSSWGPARITDGAGDESTNKLEGLPVVVAAATARPAEVAAAAGQLGAQMRAFYPFADHHPYGPETLALLERACRREGAQALLVTAKDAVKLPRALGQTPVWTLHRPLQVSDPTDVLGAALARVFVGHNFCLPRNTCAPAPDTYL